MRRIAALFLCGAVFAGAIWPTEAPAETLRAAIQLASTHRISRNLEAFKSAAEAAGGPTIEIHGFGTLVSDRSAAQAVASGEVDIAVIPASRLASLTPAANLFGLPFIFRNRAAALAALQPGAAIRTLIEGAAEENGVRILWWIDYGSAVFISATDSPIREPTDVKGRKLRVLGEMSGSMVKQLGGSPIRVKGSQQLLALQRGLVDGGIARPTGFAARKLEKAAKSVTLPRHAARLYVAIINSTVWTKATDAERAAMESASKQAENQAFAVQRALEKQADVHMKSKGVIIVELAANQVASWRKAISPLIDSYIARTGDLGRKLIEAAKQR